MRYDLLDDYRVVLGLVLRDAVVGGRQAHVRRCYALWAAGGVEDEVGLGDVFAGRDGTHEGREGAASGLLCDFGSAHVLDSRECLY